ncbi:hypothetical protein C8J56DRAFT_959759, partial [Mycena floridula]
PFRNLYPLPSSREGAVSSKTAPLPLSSISQRRWREAVEQVVSAMPASDYWAATCRFSSLHLSPFSQIQPEEELIQIGSTNPVIIRAAENLRKLAWTGPTASLSSFPISQVTTLRLDARPQGQATSAMELVALLRHCSAFEICNSSSKPTPMPSLTVERGAPLHLAALRTLKLKYPSSDLTIRGRPIISDSIPVSASEYQCKSHRAETWEDITPRKS